MITRVGVVLTGAALGFAGAGTSTSTTCGNLNARLQEQEAAHTRVLNVVPVRPDKPSFDVNAVLDCLNQGSNLDIQWADIVAKSPGFIHTHEEYKKASLEQEKINNKLAEIMNQNPRGLKLPDLLLKDLKTKHCHLLEKIEEQNYDIEQKEELGQNVKHLEEQREILILQVERCEHVLRRGKHK